MDQLRPTPVESIGTNLNALNTVSIADEKNVTDNATTRSFDIDNIKPESKYFTVDLMGGESDVKFASVKTPDARPDVDNHNTQYINPSTSRGNGPINSGLPGGLLKTREELRSGVKAALMVVDYVISLIAMKIAGDTRQQSFTADTQQKKLLEDVIVEYLFGKQQAMPLWLTLTFAIAGSYGLILFGAIRQRNEINKNKKRNSLNKDSSDREESRQEPRNPINKTPMSNTEMEKYKQGPSPTPPKQKFTTDTMYVKKNKDGVLEPVRTTSYSDVIETPKQRSSPEYPDRDIVADSMEKLRDYNSKGIYPMFKKNLNGKVIKIKYNSDGRPIMAGRSAKLIKRK